MSTTQRPPSDMLESLFQDIPHMLCIIGADGRLTRVNAHWKDTLGYDPDDIQGTQVLDLVHPDDIDASSAALARALAGEAILGFVARLRAKDGAYRLVEWTGRSSDGLNVFATARDVTDATAAAAELARDRKLLGETEAAAGIGTWRVDLATGQGSWSDEAYEIFGLDRDVAPEYIDAIVDRAVHPDDLSLLREHIAMAARDGVAGRVDCRVVRPDGSIRWINAEARPERGPDGVMIAVAGFIQDVTDRKEAELALAASENMLKESQQVARVGHYVFDTVTDHWDGSEVLYDIFGIGPEYVRDFEGWVALCHPDDLEGMRAYVLEDVLGRRAPFDKQYRIVRPSDGAVRWMYGHGRLSLDAEGRPISLFGVIQDITELKNVEERFRRERDQLTAIMETSRVGILFVDLDGRITMANRRAEEVLGLSRESITSMTYDATDWRSRALDGSPLAPEHLAVGRVIATGEAVTDVRQSIEWPDGRKVVISINAAPLAGPDGTVTGVVAAFDDITEAAKADAEIRGLNEDLEDRVRERTAEVESAMRELASTNLRLEEASAAKSRLLANMSHELRTPLNSVIGFSTILLQGMAGPLNEEQQRQLGMIKHGGTTLLSLVDDILDLTRVEAGVTQLELSDFVVGEVVDSLVDSMRPQVEEKGLKLTASTSCADLTMHSDRGKIGQILLNLLSNAVKFTDGGSIEIVCEACEECVAFRVTDTGIGIPADELPLIMDDFHQVDRLEDGMKPRGTGLGLAISWRLANMLGGTLTAESVLGQGSTFILRVPARLERRASVRSDRGSSGPS